jgi:hypothetical protein
VCDVSCRVSYIQELFKQIIIDVDDGRATTVDFTLLGAGSEATSDVVGEMIMMLS